MNLCVQFCVDFTLSVISCVVFNNLIVTTDTMTIYYSKQPGNKTRDCKTQLNCKISSAQYVSQLFPHVGPNDAVDDEVCRGVDHHQDVRDVSEEDGPDREASQ